MGRGGRGRMTEDERLIVERAMLSTFGMTGDSTVIEIVGGVDRFVDCVM